MRQKQRQKQKQKQKLHPTPRDHNISDEHRIVVALIMGAVALILLAGIFIT